MAFTSPPLTRLTGGANGPRQRLRTVTALPATAVTRWVPSWATAGVMIEYGEPAVIVTAGLTVRPAALPIAVMTAICPSHSSRSPTLASAVKADPEPVTDALETPPVLTVPLFGRLTK